ncbi:MAG: DUF3293 domain-containing protein [Marmoricola sp.]
MADATFEGWDAYGEAVVDVDLGEREVTVGREGIVRGEAWSPDRPAYVITAHNPGRKADAAANDAAQARLLALLHERGIRWRPAIGRSRDRSWAEPSVVVEIPEREALEIGARFDQDAIFRWDGTALEVIACRKI